MLSRVSTLLAATFLSGVMLVGIGDAAQAQMRRPVVFPAGEFDPAQLPEFKGKVAQYTLSPRGEVDGLILADGTEVQVAPNLSSALVFSVKPGDQVSIRGLKARAVPMIAAVTITNPANGAVIGGGEAAGPHRWDGPRMEVSGKVKAVLHTTHGDVNGVLLEDGTTLRVPPHAATKLGDLLKPGATVAASGFGVSNALGKSIAALEIGPSADKLTRVEMPHPEHWGHDGAGPDGMMGHGMMGDMMRRHMDGQAPAPDGATPPPR
jgi:hypothetical protein